MKIVGITGGIGSGKTTVSNFFNSYGVPVYYADKEAKALMNRSKIIRRRLIQIFGNQAYKGDVLNRDYLRLKIFNDKALLEQMNNVVHPKVKSHFKRWISRQNSNYILKEVAIIFENNLQSQYDYIITVAADKDLRIQRVIKRDNISKESVLSIIKNQLPDKEKIEQSDFVIFNNNLAEAEQQTKIIHQKLLDIFEKSSF